MKKQKKQPKKVVGEIPKYNSLEERKAAFEELLLQKGIRPGAVWAEVVNACEDDVRYVGVGKLGFKKQLYAEWSSKKKKEEVQQERVRRRKIREDFNKLLEECDRITDKTRWREAELYLKSDSRFEALDDNPTLRKELFEDYVQDLINKAVSDQKKKQQENEDAFKQVLVNNLKITAKTKWEDAKEDLRGNIFYESLDRSVRSKIFDAHILSLETKNRNAFNDMVFNKIMKGEIGIVNAVTSI